MFEPINIRRTLLIARRDYLGYIKTWGFWISFIMPFVFGILAFLYSTADINLEPVRYEAILDETDGNHKAAIEAKAQQNYDALRKAALLKPAEFVLSSESLETLKTTIEVDGIDAGLSYLAIANPDFSKQVKMPKRDYIFIDPPADNIEALRPYMRADKMMRVDGKNIALNGVLHIRNTDPISADYWSRQVNAYSVRNLAQRYFRDRAEADYLASKGLSKKVLSEIRADALPVTFLDPSKEKTDNKDDQIVSIKDRAPFFVAAALSMILWFTVFSGSYMLLTSMLEEKLNKLLEMMLASTRLSEIIFGKLIGVAALTITAMLPYILLSIGGLIAIMTFADAETSAAVMEAFTPKLIIFFIIFLVLGYVFYGALFIALGAMANSMQDAQTLTTPIMLILTFSVLVVPHGVKSPESSLLLFASWFPLSAPFAALIRLPSDPPLWELCLSALFLAILSLGVIWLAGRMFRYGVLSGGGVKNLFSRFKRQKTDTNA